MSVHELFVRGIKPALLVSYKRRQNRVLLEDNTAHFNRYKDDFPYIVFEHRNSVLFFNDELSKEWFETNGCVCFKLQTGEWIQDFKQDLLGHILGFPPVAVSYFMSTDAGAIDKEQQAHIDYHGISFVCRKADIKQCLDWLKEYRPVPDDLKLSSGVIVTTRERVGDTLVTYKNNLQVKKANQLN